jgi:hypothetical protein
MHSKRVLALSAALSVSLLAFSANSVAAVAADGTVSLLTGPQAGDGYALAVRYFEQQRAAMGLTERDVADLVVKDDYLTSHNGVRHLYWRQRYDGIEVWNADLAINVSRNGSIINLNNGLVANLASKVVGRPEITAAAAIEAAARNIGVGGRMPILRLTSEVGIERKATYTGSGISADDIPARLIYQPMADGSVKLAWDLVIREINNANWWSTRIDAESGEVISKINWTASDSDEKALTGANVQYRVFPFPSENPNETAHLVVTDPNDLIASPFGWHDTNMVAGNEFSDTRGNNVSAQEDIDGNNIGGARPLGTGTPLLFDFAFTPTSDPEVGSNLSAATVNLFYWNNIMHDVSYQYGFDEVAGNFQVNNYGHPGLANDAVNADSLDQLNTGANNNANFSTPVDGVAGRMQMFRWLSPVEVLVTAPAGIAGAYAGSAAGFGPIFSQAGISGALQLVDDGVAPGSDSCTASPAGSLTGKIAVLDRGTCEFGLKALNAQQAGASAVIVVNNVPGPPTGMGPGNNGGSVTISALMVSLDTGNLIKAQLPSPGVNVTMRSTMPHRDSDMDAGIIAHEYGHGISNRLTGGPANSSCLGGTSSEQGGEGWSDFWALVLHARATDTATTARFIGAYSSFQTRATGPGIRNFPYSTDPFVSPQTYQQVATTNFPHGVGEIWAGALWNMYWNLVEAHGFSADLYNGTAGNNLAIQLVVDGMKLQPCSPTMVQARDAILLADANNNAGANACAIWRGFALKGLGVGAVGGTFTRGDEIPSSALPPQCPTNNFLFSNGFE